MFSAIFLSLHLVSATGIAWPDPYLGFGMGVFPNDRYSINPVNSEIVTQRDRDSFVTLGLPFRILAQGDQWNSTDYFFTPELGFTSSIVQFNLTFGPEFEKPLGYRSRLSGIVYGIQGGFHYASLSKPSTPVKKDGTEFSDMDKNSIAFLLSFPFGPRFVLSEDIALRFIINPRLMFGQIAPRTFALPQHDWIGLTINFNLQLEFSKWLPKVL